MAGGVVVIVVLGAIAFARFRMGDRKYENVVEKVFLWWFGLAFAILGITAFFYRVLGIDLFA